MELNGSKQTRTVIFNYIPIFFITIYRFLFARFFFGNCRFIPSCSEYALWKHLENLVFSRHLK